MTTQTQNKDGQYVPAIPEPYYGFTGVKCECGKWFRGFFNDAEAEYRGHYALEHILKI